MSTTESLCPGYKQVESFGPDEEYEEEEEVSYVTLDLGAGVEPTLLASSSTYRLIGLDTPTPFMQLSGTIFKGQHDSLLGTEIFFTEEKADGTDRAKRSVVPVGTTEQRIRFKEVQLRRKSDVPPADPFVHENPTSMGYATTSTTTTSNVAVDRMTGKTVPVPRAAKGKGKEKEKKGKKKGKGKEKETEPAPAPAADSGTQNNDEEEDVTMGDIPIGSGADAQANPDDEELMDVGDG